MADSPGGADIKVTPSAIDAAASHVRSAEGAVRSGVTAVAAQSVGVVGDPACADALATTYRLVAGACSAAADGLDDLAHALFIAPGSYRLADAGAVPMVAR